MSVIANLAMSLDGFVADQEDRCSAWFAGARGPVQRSDPGVRGGHGVTHLRYQVADAG